MLEAELKRIKDHILLEMKWLLRLLLSFPNVSEVSKPITLVLLPKEHKPMNESKELVAFSVSVFVWDQSTGAIREMEA